MRVRAQIQNIHTGTPTYDRCKNGRKNYLRTIAKNISARAACMYGAGIHRYIDSENPAHILRVGGQACVQVAAGDLCSLLKTSK